ncbi:iron-containing alcohol dehydrogenase [Streptomyces sp. NPDC097610]|uniref:iron-containing alcohol dehydrogenase n=1 Tax=Streptomyces sp. NPDC097610 TaxID=3157227 RepID=UPI003320D30F
MLVTRSALRIAWGTDALDRLPGELRRLGVRKPMLLHASELTGSPLLGKVHTDTEPVVTFGEVVAHTPIDSVLAAAELAAAHGVDGLVALGGGSVAVTSRAVAIASGEDGDLRSLATHRDDAGRVVSPRLSKPKMPIVVLPTTPSTAYGKVGTAVTVPGSAERLALFDPKTRAASLVVSADALATAPGDLVRNAGLTTMVMAAEGMTTRKANMFSDADLGQALSILVQDLAAARKNNTASDDGQSPRVRVALAALLVGSGTDLTGGGLTAALSHTLGHTVSRHNGLIDAVVLPHVLAHMGHAAPERLTGLAKVLDCRVTELAGVTSDIFARLSAPSRLGDLGVLVDVLPAIAEDAMNDFAVQTSGCEANSGILRSILEAAW